MIPKLLHQIWIGPNPIPEKEKEWMKSWKNNHPDWNHCLWTNDNLPELDDNCKKVVESLKVKYALIADIYRYVILYKYGGFYADTDILSRKPIDDMIDYDFVGLFPRVNVNYITNAFFGCIPQHPVLKDCIEKVKPVPEEHYKHGYLLTSGAWLTKNLYSNYPNLKGKKLVENPYSELKILPCETWGNMKNYPNGYMYHYARASHLKV